MRFVLMFVFISCFCIEGAAEVLFQWRGPQRDGNYPATELLTEWPENGPRMLWAAEGLGAGHGSVSIAHDQIFVAGMTNGTGILYAFEMNGTRLWHTAYGPEWDGNYPGARSTPTIVNDRLYLESGQGIVYCFDTVTGNIVWSVDLLKKFNAENIQWGMSESLLMDGDRVICTPGGPQHNVVALNRFTGETVWTSPGNGEPAAYCSPILINHNGTRLIVTMTAESIIGVDAETGTFYWRVPQHQRNKIHANTPVYVDGHILCSSASDKTHSGLVTLKLSPDAKSAEVVWRNEEFENLMGGIIVRDGVIYGSRYRRSEWQAIDFKTGALLTTFEELDSGVIVFADGLFYCYAEDGTMALVQASPESFRVISSFQVPLGTDQHWAHPVIREGRLYIRHGDALMVYDISQ